MTPERWAFLKSLFDRALATEECERDAFVHAACSGDAELEHSLAALLRHNQAASSVLSGPMLSPERMAEIVNSGLRTFLPGELVAGRFSIESFIAEGGMGEVYAAMDLELGELVALKTIRPELARDQTVLAGFKREILLARKITHHNVSRVFDLFRHDVELDGQRRSIMFLSMELLKGETLAARIHRDGPFRLANAENIAAQLIAGLEAAHAVGIIHADFKSGNIALVRDSENPEGGAERAVVMDFGLAGTRATLGGADRAIGLVGTPAYMAPEQVEHAPVTPAADIYALGVVLFEILAGNVPFRGDSPLETAYLRLTQDPPSLRSVAPDAPLPWDRTVRDCLQRDPLRRPQSAGEVAARLSGRFERRRRLRTIVLAALAVGILIWGTYWARLPDQPSMEAQTAADGARVKIEAHTQSGFIEGINEFRRATVLDPKWAQAWAELAYAYVTAANVKQVPAVTAAHEARAAALRAIGLDSRSAKAFGALGWVQSLDFDEWPKAEETLRHALRLNSGDAQVHYWLGVHLRKKGRFAAAEAEDRQAILLSHQTDPSMWCELAFLYWTSGRIDQMGQFMKELLVAYPNFGLTRYLNARLLKEEGQFDRALEELKASESLQYTAVTVLAERASVEAYRGDFLQARADLRRLTEESETQPVDGLLIAGIHAKLGDLDSAFEWLERAYAHRDNTLLSLATSPVLKPLRADPRYASLLRRLHFAS